MSNYPAVIKNIFENRAEARFDSAEDERAAILAAQSGNEEATFALMYAYAAAMRNGIKWYTNAMAAVSQAPDLEDVRMSAVMGVLEAINAFNPDKFDRLAGLVSDKIAEAVGSHAQDVCGMTVPQRSLTRFFSILRKVDGNVYKAAALAPTYHMTTETFLSILSSVRSESYDAAKEDNEGGFNGTTGERYSTGQDRGVATFETSNTRFESDAEDRILAEAALSAVDDLEEDVCRLAYGFSDYEPVPDGEIGFRLGLSRPKTQRVRAGALGKMRVALGLDT